MPQIRTKANLPEILASIPKKEIKHIIARGYLKRANKKHLGFNPVVKQGISIDTEVYEAIKWTSIETGIPMWVIIYELVVEELKGEPVFCRKCKSPNILVNTGPKTWYCNNEDCEGEGVFF